MPDWNLLIINILTRTSLAEVSLIIIVLYLINWLNSKLLKQMGKISQLNLGNNAKSLHGKIKKTSILIGLVLCVLVVGANGWLIYQGENIQEYTIALMGRLPASFWVNLGTRVAKSIITVTLAAVSIRPLYSLLDYGKVRAQQLNDITANDLPIEIWFYLLKKHLTNCIWLLAVLGCSQFLGLPAIVVQYLSIFLKSYAIIAAGLLAVKAQDPIIDSLDALSNKYASSDSLLRFYSDLRHLVPLLKQCLKYAIYASMATLAIEQVEPIAFLAAYGQIAVKIIGIIFLSRVFIQVNNLAVSELLLHNQVLTERQRQKSRTIIPLIQSALKYLIYFGASIGMLKTINIDPTPILAGAGIIGLAVGFGAQNLVNDLVSGFFILFDNYYLVGDEVEIDDIEGEVEAIDLRTTRIRHGDGQLCILRNGEINNVINYSKEYVYAVVEVGVAYDSNLDRVYQVIQAIGKQLKEKYSEVLEPTHVDGLESFREYDLLIRTITKVKPGTHEEIQRILRKMIKETFDQEGIEIPFARTSYFFMIM
ncbi:MAG: mechanosensitive ion channel family protein [Hormoscilla sp. GM7CHS1pb]|nr:mechanosensitive ion channel family protein [Hormoscilla sp. GM7CHS1pb]